MVARQRQFKGLFVQADLAHRLPFADGLFDTTVCLDVLEHVADDGQTIRELARVTRRRLVLAVPQADQWMWRYRLISILIAIPLTSVTTRLSPCGRWLRRLGLEASTCSASRDSAPGSCVAAAAPPQPLPVAHAGLPAALQVPGVAIVFIRAVSEPRGRHRSATVGASAIVRVGVDVQLVAGGNRSGLYNFLRHTIHELRPLLHDELWLFAEMGGHPGDAAGLSAAWTEPGFMLSTSRPATRDGGAGSRG